jgi:chemotaxis protein methyltransferase CheR
MLNTKQAMSVPGSLSERDFSRLGVFIENACGIKMVQSKRAMLESRLVKRLRATSIPTTHEYVDYLFSPEGQAHEQIHMIDAVTTNKTDFFREPEHYVFLSKTVLPSLSDDGTAGNNVLVWSAGCSSGEEPYTLAMVMSEYGVVRRNFKFRILATDISTRVLDAARHGVYEEEKVEPVPMEIRRKYLLRSKDSSRGLVKIVPAVRSLIEFRRLNLMDEDYSIQSPVDVIFCRNVIIYFDRATQMRLMTHFIRHLRPGGFLFLGHSESLYGLNLPLVQAASTVYRRPL